MLVTPLSSLSYRFGDTVNLAYGIESSGKKNRIHCSQSTAALLIGAGKEQWISKRKELVNASGMGLIQTYWIRRTATSSSNNESEPTYSDSGLNQSAMTKGQPNKLTTEIQDQSGQIMRSRKFKRLVEWQTAVLSKLLRNVVAKRKQMQIASYLVPSPDTVIEKRIPLDEVTELLKLPQFHHSSGGKDEAECMDLDPVVENELEAYIGVICSKYNDNRKYFVRESRLHSEL